MTHYRINKTANAASIELTELGGKQQQLLKAFQDCAEGRCSCPTNEYKKVASMQIQSDDDGIDIWLEARPGANLQVSQIANCLASTLASVEGDPERSPYRTGKQA